VQLFAIYGRRVVLQTWFHRSLFRFAHLGSDSESTYLQAARRFYAQMRSRKALEEVTTARKATWRRASLYRQHASRLPSPRTGGMRHGWAFRRTRGIRILGHVFDRCGEFVCAFLCLR
jgi:hypothetical protein